jgi:hypothetical protein
MRSSNKEVRTMPVWGWIVIAVLAVITVAAIVVAARNTSSRKRTEGLKERFGPEYERVVGDTDDQRAAESELVAREKNRQKLDIVALPIEAATRYADKWRDVQTAFIDSPSGAVIDADRLVTEVMRERGYPVDDFDQRAADISVDHPQIVESYRAAHTIYLSQEHDDIGTEDQREAFVHYRALFEKLLETENDAPKEARA